MLTIFFFMIIILLGGNMFDKATFVMKNKLMYLPNEKVVEKCLDKNILISTLAKDELISRDNLEMNVNDDTILSVINKLSIEQVWNLVTRKDNSQISKLALKKLNEILEYYQNSLEYHEKINEGKSKIFYFNTSITRCV